MTAVYTVAVVYLNYVHSISHKGSYVFKNPEKVMKFDCLTKRFLNFKFVISSGLSSGLFDLLEV